MSPRPYRSARRRETAAATREKIIGAARDLLDAEPGRLREFSIEAVARRAGVARMTVYYQFESRAGLLQALFDTLAERGQLSRIPEVFEEPDLDHALDLLVAIFGGFWSANRVAHRHLRAAAVIDADLAEALDERSERRRRLLRSLLSRFAPEAHPAARERTVDALYMLTQIESYDTLAGQEGKLESTVPLVQRLARTTAHELLTEGT